MITFNGIRWSISLDSPGNNVIEVTLKVENRTPNGGPNLPLTIQGVGYISASSCEVTMPVAVTMASFTVNCTSVSLSGRLKINVAPTVDDFITIPVTVTTAGYYEITTNTVSGVSFSGSGMLTTTNTSVKLKVTGTPTQGGGDTDFTLTYNGGTCSIKVKILGNTFNILTIGTAGGVEVNATNDYGKMLLSSNNFGPAGTVVSKPITLESSKSLFSITKNDMLYYLWQNDIDLIFIMAEVSISSNGLDGIADWMDTKKGMAYLFASLLEGDSIIRKLSGDNSIVTTRESRELFVKAVAGQSISTGPFMNMGSFRIGADLSNFRHITAGKSSFTQLAGGYTTYPADMVVAKHNSKPLIYNGITHFHREFSSPPFKINTNGTPTSVFWNSQNVYNSYYFGNIIAWFVEYRNSSGNAKIDTAPVP